MPTPEEITNPLIAALQSRIAEAAPPVAELTPEEQAEARAAEEQSSLARKYFSRDIISEARQMAEAELPKNRFLRALVGMGEGAAQYYNPKTFQSREDRAFDRLEKDFQRRGPVLQRDLAAYEGTAARNEQKRLDRQAKLEIADQKDRAEAQKLLLQNAKFLADDPVRKAKVEALIASKDFQNSKTKARDLENAFMAETGAKMGSAPTNAMTALMAKKNPELGVALETQKEQDALRKALFGGLGKQLGNLGEKRSTSFSPGKTTLKTINGQTYEVTGEDTTTSRVSGSNTISPAFLQLFQSLRKSGGVANAPGILGGSAASELPTVPPAGAERGAGLASSSATAVPSPGVPVAQRRGGGTAPTNTPSRAELAQVAARSGVPVPTAETLNEGGKLKLRKITGSNGKPMSATAEQQESISISLQGALDDSIKILSGGDTETREQFEKQMYPTGGGFWGRVPVIRDELPKQREADIIDWQKSKDPKKQKAYLKYQELVAKTAEAQWKKAIEASGKAINQNEQQFINRMLISIKDGAINDTPEQAMNKLISQRLAIGMVNLKVATIKNGAPEAYVESINLADDMEKAADRIMAKYRKKDPKDPITAEDFRPEVNYPTLIAKLGDRMGAAISGGDSAPGASGTNGGMDEALKSKLEKWRAGVDSADPRKKKP